jgi:tRNA(Arg) A34 adenosine deaminase TadA
MERAIELSAISSGGPFGAVIVDKNGNIIGEGHNEVTLNNDPTAHAEMVAIRRACANIGNFNLQGCTIYTSCEPCPMCLSACYWARLDKINYANTREDAAYIGFDDEYIYEEIKKNKEDRKIPMISHNNTISKQIFKKWFDNVNNIRY